MARILPVERNIMDILDIAKIADYLILVTSAIEEVDAFGTMVLSCIKAQGVPVIVHAVQHLSLVPANKQANIKKSLISFMSHHFPDTQKLFNIECSQEMSHLLRVIASQTPKKISWRDPYAYLVSEEAKYMPDGSLSVIGHVRGQCWNINRIVHISNVGDVRVSSIRKMNESNRSGMDMDDSVLINDKHEPIMAFKDLNPLDGEQTWPDDQEMAHYNDLVMSDVSDQEMEEDREYSEAFTDEEEFFKEYFGKPEPKEAEDEEMDE
jgi:pre-rRNA-processing protein TSR1